jgi:hypothetical protein
MGARQELTAARALFLSALFVCPIIGLAQAWVPEKGEGTETLVFQDNFVKDHFGSGGQRMAWVWFFALATSA